MNTKQTPESVKLGLENLRMRSLINLHNNPSGSQIETDFTYLELEPLMYEMMEAGYKVLIVEELGKNQFIVKGKHE